MSYFDDSEYLKHLPIRRATKRALDKCDELIKRWKRPKRTIEVHETVENGKTDEEFDGRTDTESRMSFQNQDSDSNSGESFMSANIDLEHQSSDDHEMSVENEEILHEDHDQHSFEPNDNPIIDEDEDEISNAYASPDLSDSSHEVDSLDLPPLEESDDAHTDIPMQRVTFQCISGRIEMIGNIMHITMDGPISTKESLKILD